MSVRKQDASRAISLLEDYCARLRKPEEQQLKTAILRVMDIFKSSLFQALLDIQEFYEATLLNSHKSCEQKLEEVNHMAEKWESPTSTSPVDVLFHGPPKQEQTESSSTDLIDKEPTETSTATEVSSSHLPSYRPWNWRREEKSDLSHLFLVLVLGVGSSERDSGCSFTTCKLPLMTDPRGSRAVFPKAESESEGMENQRRPALPCTHVCVLFVSVRPHLSCIQMKAVIKVLLCEEVQLEDAISDSQQPRGLDSLWLCCSFPCAFGDTDDNGAVCWRRLVPFRMRLDGTFQFAPWPCEPDVFSSRRPVPRCMMHAPHQCHQSAISAVPVVLFQVWYSRVEGSTRLLTSPCGLSSSSVVPEAVSSFGDLSVFRKALARHRPPTPFKMLSCRGLMPAERTPPLASPPARPSPHPSSLISSRRSGSVSGSDSGGGAFLCSSAPSWEAIPSLA
ncbi:hypothetical protein ACEWY4_009528 [Coilia grayii]|uniref:L27 domain-containing protein n=1 Tax=Coilia grayii TaxID=363190 RepID=A0ABD1K6V2_9TELE